MSFFNWFKKKMYLSRPSTSDVSNEDQKLVIPLEGNSFLTSKSENSQAEVTKQGWVNWTEREDVFSMYFKVNKPGKLKVRLLKLIRRIFHPKNGLMPYYKTFLKPKSGFEIFTEAQVKDTSFFRCLLL